jgi:sulfite reductase (NADPH) hemoprotein beta-component
MYRYDSIDQQIVNDRVSQFRDQTERFLRGTLGEEEFRVLRLRPFHNAAKYSIQLA